MKTRKWVVLSCLVVLCVLSSNLGLAASASGEDEWLKDVKSRLAGTQITLLVSSHPSQQALQKMTPAFEKATGISVKWSVIEESALYGRILMELTANTKRIDALMVCPEYLYGLVQLGAIEPLNDYVSRLPDWFGWDDIVPSYRHMLTADDSKIYGVPFAGESGFLMYRKDLFERYGKEIPQTYDELLALAQFFHDKDLDGDGKPDLSGISFRGRRGWGMNWPWALLTFPFGGQLVDPKAGQPMFDSPGTVAALDYLVKAAQVAPDGIESFGHYEAWTSMMTGKSALLIESTAAAPLMEDPTKSAVVGKVGYAPLPKGPAGSYSGVWGWGIAMSSNVDTKQKEAVWAFMTYMLSERMQEEYLDNGGVVTRTSGHEILAKQGLPYTDAVIQALAQANDLSALGMSVVPKIPEWMEVVELMGTYGSMAVAGQLSAEAAARLTQQTVEEVVK